MPAQYARHGPRRVPSASGPLDQSPGRTRAGEVSEPSEQDPQPPTDPSAIADAISTEMVRIHRESYGSGAKAVKTYVHDDLVLSVLDVELLPAEAVVIASGRSDLVLDMRCSFQLELETSFTAAVERAPGRKVPAFLSDPPLDPPFVTELFRLGPPHDVELAEPETPFVITRRLESTLDAASAARHLVENVAERLPGKLYDVVRLLVTELVSNAVRHSGAAPDATIEFVLSISDAKVRLEVTDAGAGFVPVARSDEARA